MASHRRFSHLFDVLVFVDAGCQGGGEALVHVWLGRQLLQHLHALLGEELLFGLLIQAVQALLVRLAEVDGVDVGLVHGLHVALDGADAHGHRPVDACGEALVNMRCFALHLSFRPENRSEQLSASPVMLTRSPGCTLSTRSLWA